ncbi:hypothetical protein GEMRC1_010224 [Eukaryota sp. GEM-RC1]
MLSKLCEISPRLSQKSKLAQKDSQLKELSSVANTLACEKSTLAAKLKSEQESSERILLSIDTTQTMCNKLGDDLSGLAVQISKGEEVFSTANNRLHRYDHLLSLLREKIKKLTIELDQTKRELVSIDEKRIEAEETSKEVHAKEVQIQERMTRLQKERQSENELNVEKIQRLSADLQKANDSLSTLKNEIQVKQLKISELTEQFAKEKETIWAQSEASIAELKEQQYSTEQCLVTDHQRIVSAHETEKQQLNEQILTLVEEINSLEKKTENLTEQLACKNDLLNEQSNEIEQLRNDNAKLTSENQQFASKVKKLAHQSEVKLQEKDQQLKALQDTLQSTLNEAQKSKETARITLKDMVKERDELKRKLSVEITERENQRLSFEQKLNSEASKESSATVAIQELQAQLNALKQEREEWLIDSGNQAVIIEELTAETEKFRKSTSALQSEYDVLTEKSQKLIEKFRNLKSEFDNSKTTSEESIVALNQKLNNMTEQLEQIENSKTELLQEKQLLTETNTTLEAQINQLNSEVSNLKEKLDQTSRTPKQIRSSSSQSSPIVTDLRSPSTRRRRPPQLDSQEFSERINAIEATPSFTMVTKDDRAPKSVKDLSAKPSRSLSSALEDFSQTTPLKTPVQKAKRTSSSVRSTKTKSKKKNRGNDDLFDDVFKFS